MTDAVMRNEKKNVIERSEFVTLVTQKLLDRGVTKPLPPYRHKFFIMDEDDNKSSFTVYKKGRKVQFSQRDISVILEAMTDVVLDQMKRGKGVRIPGFGIMFIHYRKPRSVRHPATGKRSIVPEQYVPKFDFGTKLRLSTKLYQLSLKDPTGLEDIPTAEHEMMGGDDLDD